MKQLQMTTKGGGGTQVTCWPFPNPELTCVSDVRFHAVPGNKSRAACWKSEEGMFRVAKKS